jgi:hypothetical protein
VQCGNRMRSQRLQLMELGHNSESNVILEATQIDLELKVLAALSLDEELVCPVGLPFG